MSMYSGKFDLADYIAGLGGWFDRDGNPVKMGQKGVSVYYSDELLDFEAFKKKTGGKLYQHRKVQVSIWNQDFVKEHCKFFDYVEVEEEVEDKRCKDGKGVKTYYIYSYYGKGYTLKQLNKKGVYIEVEIRFRTLLDLMQYYPYLVTFSSTNDDETHVVISDESFAISEYQDTLDNGGQLEYPTFYTRWLQQHYLEVCKNYFLKDLDKRTKQISLITCKPLHDGYYELLVDDHVDYMHEIKFVWKDGKVHTHWGSPILDEKEDYCILVSAHDIEEYLADDIKNDRVAIQYVAKMEHERILH